MRKSGFSLGLIIASNILIIIISLVYGLHVLPYPKAHKATTSSDLNEEFRDLTIIQKQS
jgi:hypothetical protein